MFDCPTILSSVLVMILGVLPGCSSEKESTSLAYFHNGHIYSLDDAGSTYTAMIIEKGKIMKLGGEEIKSEIEGRKFQTIDLQNRYVFPGLIEGHGHFMSLGEVVCGLDVSGSDSWEEVLNRTEKYAQENDGQHWIVGKGWHPNHWTSLPENTTEGYPDHRELSRLFPDRPVILQHSSFHALLANQKALEIAGVNRETTDPDGGRIIRFPDGSPSGMFEENAMELVMMPYRTWKSNRPDDDKNQELKQHLDSATQHCLSYGITTFVDAGVSADEFHFFEDYHDHEGLDLRIWAMTSGPQLLDGAFDSIVPYRSADDHLFVQATKAFIDGALGSNGAWMVEDYTDQPGWQGQNVTDLEVLRLIGQKCIDLGLQYCVHAIGDRANHEVLNIFGELFEENNRQGDTMRWRIEHAQIIQPSDIQRFFRLGVIPAMQAIHCTSDAPMVVPKIGETLAREGGYPWRSLIDQGAIIANGTDAPVERVDPFENLFASVTRRSTPDDAAFFPEQSMTREEALKSLTIWNAYATKLEDQTGSLEGGKWADFIVLDTDLLHCPDVDLLNAQVQETYVGGELVWSRDNQ